MTTITIKEDVQLTNTTFENVEELVKALLHTSPLKVFQTDADEFPSSVVEKIANSKSDTNKKLSNFQG